MKTINVKIIAWAMILWSASVAQAQTTYTRQNNTSLLNDPAAWGGTAPTGSDIAKWDATCGANVGTTLGGNVTWGQILLTNNVGSAVTIANTASSMLTLNGVSGVGIDMSAANQNLTINNLVTLGAAQMWTVGSGRTLTVSQNYTITNGGFLLTIDGNGSTTWSAINQATATLAGSGGLTKNGSGRFSFSGNNTGYSGTTTLNGGVTVVNTVGSIGSGNLTLNGGVYEEYWTASFTRGLGAGPGQVQILGGTSGFSENGSTGMTINFAGTNEVQWASAFFAPSTLVLQESSAQANSALDFQDGMDLNGATRTVAVNKTSVGSGYAKISGLIRTSSGTAGMIKTGPGILILSANNTYNGSTTVSGGVVDFGGIALGFGSGRDISVAAGAAVMRTALNNTFLNRLVETSDEIGLFTGTTGNNLDLSSSTGANLPNAFLGQWNGSSAKADYSGTITPASDAYRLGHPRCNGNLGISVAHSDVGGSKGLIVGGGRVVLTGANTFTGDTTIRSGGLLSLGNALALQNSALDVGSSGGSFACESASCSMGGFGGSAIRSPTLGGLKGSRNLLSAYSSTALNNSSPLLATRVIGFTLNPGSGVTCTYSGLIENFTNNTTVTKSGAGTQILSGTNTFSGATTISAGILSLGHALALQNSPLNTTGSVIGDANNGLQTTVTTLTLGGLTGNKNLADIFTTTSGGYSSVTALTLNPISGATPSYSGVIADGASGMALIKNGAGSQTLSGVNVYSGSTTVNAGTLLVNSPGSLPASSAVTIAGGATLAGDGTINGAVAVSNGGTLGGTATINGAVAVSYGGTLGGTVTINGAVTASLGAILSPAGSGTIGTLTLANAGDALTLNGSKLNFDLPASGTVCDLFAVTGNVVVNGQNIVTISGPAGVAAGTYTLMTYGSTNGVGSIVFVNGSTTMGNLTLTVGATSLTLTVGAGGYSENVWKGTVNGVWDTSTANWTKNGVAGQTYANGDYVTIDDTATATTLSNSVAVSPAAVTVNNSAKNFIVTATLGGTGTPLLKSGSGTLTLSGTNTYSGGTLLSAGTLSISANNNLGANGSAITFNGSGGLIMTAAMTNDHPIALGTNVLMSLQNTTGNSTMSGAITGNGGISWVAGGSSLTLSSTGNTFTGPIIAPNSPNNNDTLNFTSIGDAPGAGTISFSRNSYFTHIGYSGSPNLTLNYRQIEIKGYGVDGMGSPVNQLMVNGSGSLTIMQDLLPSGAAGARLLGLSGTGTGAGYFNGRLVDGAGLVVSITKKDNNKWTLSGTNTYSGLTIVSAGTLNVQNDNGLGTTAGGVSVSANAALELQGGIAIGAEALALNGGGVSSGGALRNISGENSYAGLITQGSASRINSDTNTLTLDVASGNAITGTYNLTFGGAGNIAVADPIATSTGTVAKDGNGTVMLSGTNTYSGLTTVSAGILNVQNDNGLGTTAGGVSVTSGAALELQGGIAIGTEALTLNGTGISSGGALRNISGDNSYAGLISLGSATRINSDANTLTLDVASGNAITNTQNLTFGGTGNIAVADPIATSTGTVTKDGSGTLTLLGTNTYSGATTIRVGTLVGVTGGACASSAVTVTNTPGVTSVLAIHVTNTNLPWNCSSLAFKTNGVGAQLKFSFAVAPSISVAPLNITGNLAFTGAPVVVVNTANVPAGIYPLLVAGGTAPSAIPALDLMGSTLNGTLAWGGTGNKTLYLSLQSVATVISFF